MASVNENTPVEVLYNKVLSDLEQAVINEASSFVATIELPQDGLSIARTLNQNNFEANYSAMTKRLTVRL